MYRRNNTPATALGRIFIIFYLITCQHKSKQVSRGENRTATVPPLGPRIIFTRRTICPQHVRKCPGVALWQRNEIKLGTWHTTGSCVAWKRLLETRRRISRCNCPIKTENVPPLPLSHGGSRWLAVTSSTATYRFRYQDQLDRRGWRRRMLEVRGRPFFYSPVRP